MGPELIAGDAAEAQARSRAHALIARLVSAPSARALEIASIDPCVEDAIASYRGDRDALAADHEHVFGLSCPPYESAMLEAEGHLGGEIGDRAQRALARAGVLAGPGGEPPDHLAAQLYALGLLAGAEADAIEDDQREIAARIRASQRHLLDAHLLRWLPSLAIAVRRTRKAWPSALIDLALEVVLQHRSVLGEPDPADLVFELPPLALALDDERTGLAEIASALARPARAGALVSRDDVGEIGRATRTPRGFGDRATMIENLLRVAATFGSLPRVLDALVDRLAATRAELGSERLADVPRALREPWRARIDETCVVLAHLRAAGAVEGR